MRAQIAGSQLKSVFGVRVASQPSIFHTVYYCLEAAFVDGLINWPAFVIFIVATLMLVAVQQINKRFKPRVPLPGALIVAVVGTLVSYLAALDTPVVGVLPAIFPRPAVPSFNNVRELLPGAALIAFVGASNRRKKRTFSFCVCVNPLLLLRKE